MVRPPPLRMLRRLLFPASLIVFCICYSTAHAQDQPAAREAIGGIAWSALGALVCAGILVLAAVVTGMLVVILRRRGTTPGPAVTAPRFSVDPLVAAPTEIGIKPAPGAEPGMTAAYIPPVGSATGLTDLAAHFPQLEIIELLGKGGMGAVYKARQPHLDRFVALKILPADSARDQSFAERFSREARAMAKLNHPNIVAIHDFGQTSGGLYFLLMEYVDGVNLRHALRAGLSPQEALRITAQLCDALQFAHDEGVVHRDIKPENILLDRRGRVKVADFGLAKLLGLAADTGLTATRQVMGTLHYMAPEQLAGTRDVDHRADIYSLGVTFYEMLTGDLPLGRFPPPSKTPGVDARLDAVVLRTLERDPAERFQQASEVKSQIDSIVGLPLHAQPLAPGAAMGVPIADPSWGDSWRSQTLRTRGAVKIMLWLLTIASAIVFGHVDREFSEREPRWERMTIGLIQPWYQWGTGPNGWNRSWNPITVSGAGGVLALTCLAWLITIWRWERARRQASASEDLRDQLHRAGIWLFITGIVTVLIWIPVSILATLFLPFSEGLAHLLLIHSAWSIVAGVVILVSARSMSQVRRYGLAMTGSILAMAPLSLGAVLGMPIGIWCLVLLCRREVSDEFARAAWLAKNRDFQSAVSGDSKS